MKNPAVLEDPPTSTDEDVMNLLCSTKSNGAALIFDIKNIQFSTFSILQNSEGESCWCSWYQSYEDQRIGGWEKVVRLGRKWWEIVWERVKSCESLKGWWILEEAYEGWKEMVKAEKREIGLGESGKGWEELKGMVRPKKVRWGRGLRGKDLGRRAGKGGKGWEG